MRLSNKLVHELRPLGRKQTFEDDAIPYLLLTVYPNGKKLWFLRHRTAIGDTLISIGSFPDLDVPSARSKAKAMNKYSGEGNQIQGLLEREKSHLAKAQAQVSLTRMMKDRNGVQFRPNPIFQSKKKLSSHASDVMRDEQDKRAKESRKQELEQIEAAWKTYQKGGDLSILIPFLRNELFSYHPMPFGMGEAISAVLELHLSSQHEDHGDDNHIFMTYWRHTEFKTGVAPLLLEKGAVDECVAFMEAIGRVLSHEVINTRLREGYQDWRQKNAEKLKKSEKVLKSLMSQADDPGQEISGSPDPH